MDRLSAMETFVHVVETGSFSAVAKRLGIGQPAVSKSIAQLEARLAVRLLLRSTRGLTPTKRAWHFLIKPGVPSMRPTRQTRPPVALVPGCQATCVSARR